MFKKDFFLRQIALLLEALNKIINNISNNEIEEARMKIEEAYQLLGNNPIYFRTSTTKVLIQEFNKDDNTSLEQIKMLCQLLFYDAKTTNDKHLKEKLLTKSKKLLDYYMNKSSEFSVSLFSLTEEIRTELSDFKKGSE